MNLTSLRQHHLQYKIKNKTRFTVADINLQKLQSNGIFSYQN